MKKPITAYVSAPMRGRPRFNFPAIHEVAAQCREINGWHVWSPAENDLAMWPELESAPGFAEGDTDLFMQSAPEGYKFEALMAWDLESVSLADHFVALPGWEQSSGCKIERFVAEQTGCTIWLALPTVIPGQWTLVQDSVQKRMAEAQVATPLDILTKSEPDRVQLVRIEGEDIERLERITIGGTEHEVGSTWTVQEPETTIIGLVGYAQVGKDTLAAQLIERHGFTRIAFADVLRECLYALNPLIPSNDPKLSPWRLQEIVDRVGWEKAKQFPEVRELLQRLGTEMGREILGNDIWVDTALKKIQPGGKYVITDVRFPNEFAAIEKLGGKTVRIMRHGYGPVNGHWSETALDGYKTDFSAWNDGTPEELLWGVTKLLGFGVDAR